MTVVTSGIELATFRLVGQYDNQLRRSVPRNTHTLDLKRPFSFTLPHTPSSLQLSHPF